MSVMQGRWFRFAIALLVVVGSLIWAAPTEGATKGSLYIYKKNSDGNRIKGACFSLYTGAPSYYYFSACDATESEPDADGRIVITGIPAGSYTLHEYASPNGYALAVDRTVTIVAGERTQISVKDPKGGTTLVVSKTTTGGAALQGSCFAVYVDAGGGSFGAWVTSGCDVSDGSNDGKISIRGLKIGNYVLWESFTPVGYKRADSRPFRVTASTGTVRITVANALYPSSKTVTINKIDENGSPVAGACFQLFLPASNPYAPGGIEPGGYTNYFACDQDDGSNDGKIKIYGVEAGNYVAEEWQVPPGHVIAPVKYFSKVAGTPLTLTIVNKTGGSHLSVEVVNQSNHAVRGLCFTVYRLVDGHRGVFVNYGCDFEGTGFAQIGNLPSGKFMLQFSGWVPAAGGQSGYELANPVNFTLASNTSKTVTATVKLTEGASVSQAEASPTASASPTPTETATPTSTPEPSPVATETATSEPTVEPSPTVESTPEATATASPEAGGGGTPEATPSPPLEIDASPEATAPPASPDPTESQ